MRAWAIATLASCAHVSAPDTLPPVAQVGCVEISVERIASLKFPILEWRVTNVCDHAVPIDLEAARVVAFGPTFARTILEPAGRHRLFEPSWLDVGETDFIRIAYSPAVAARDVAIDVELDALYEHTHRPVILSLLPAASRPSRRSETADLGLGPDPTNGSP